MNKLRSKRATTCIYVQIRRHSETYFVLADEYDLVETVKARLLAILEQTGFVQKGREEALTTEEIKLSLQRRVSIQLAVSSSNSINLN